MGKIQHSTSNLSDSKPTKSTPLGSLSNNDLSNLNKDLENIHMGAFIQALKKAAQSTKTQQFLPPKSTQSKK